MTQCPFCNGAGEIEYQEAISVSREMAIDAGMREIEGQVVYQTVSIPCSHCGGGGVIDTSEVDA